jgi:lipopolysaccharide transport system ATP-binding protein
VTLAIDAEGLGKRYEIRHSEIVRRPTALREHIASLPSRFIELVTQRSRGDVFEEFWALRDATFSIREGEIVGIIGENGSGKSTLLKLLSRITEPTTGTARIRGHVGSLLEVGTGFHPDLTGRENIVLSGTILGMRRAEITRKFDEIVAFAEMEQFLDTPVKHYSSGMYTRLAFSVAAHFEPEILIVDEVLAVGDLSFQRKSLSKMSEVSRDGRTVLLVSHNMSAIENLCTRCMLLEDGRILRLDETSKVIGQFVQAQLPAEPETHKPLAERTDRRGNGQVRIVGVRLESPDGRELAKATSATPLVVAFDYRTEDGQPAAVVDVGAWMNAVGTMAPGFALYRSYVGEPFATVPGKGTLRVRIDELPLAAGRYILHGRVTVNGEEADWPYNGVAEIEVEAGDFYGTGAAGFGPLAPVLVRGAWEVR